MPSRRGWRGGGACSTSSRTWAASRWRRWRRGRRARWRWTGRRPALELAARGARQAGGVRLEVRRADAFEAMAALAAEGRRFGVVVCDPPAFAPNKAALEAGLRAYEKVARLGAALVEPDGFLVLCSCSHAADLGAVPRGEPARGGAGGAGGADPARGRGGAGPSGASGAGGDVVSQGAVPAACAREGADRRLRALSDGDAGDGGGGGGGGRVRAALVGADPRGVGAGDAAAAGGGGGGGAGGDRAAARGLAGGGGGGRGGAGGAGCRCRTRTTGTCWRRRSPAGRRC